jgi:NADH:ubiquinone oxidoreductase subunit F (NADH-binding)
LVGELADGVVQLRERERVLRWAAEIRGRGACHHPDGAARFIESALSVFADELASHQHGGCTDWSPELPLGNVATPTPEAQR